MTVSFFCPDAPSSLKEVDCGDGEVVTERVSDVPELNLGNGTAKAVMELVGMPFDEWGGEAVGVELDGFIERAMRVVNGASVDGVVTEGFVEEGAMRVVGGAGGVATIGRGATWVEAGIPEERVRRRVADLLGLLTQARKGGYKVCWG
jgi:hypothetical protein